MNFSIYMAEKQKAVDRMLDQILPREDEIPADVNRAMRYSILAGGKRLRPILCCAAIGACGEDAAPYLPAACALELVHTYSLIHDDLPAMDNDDLRRGKPTNHKVFGEAVAILSGDALLTRAFEIIADMDHVSPQVKVELVKRLACSAGTEGLVGGQALDMAGEGKEITEEDLLRIHERKTASLIETSVVFGGLLAGAGEDLIQALAECGYELGMAFQITDDILDATGDEKKMGKKLRQDQAAKKATYPALYGVERSRQIAGEHVEKAIRALHLFDHRAGPLREIARMIENREQ